MTPRSPIICILPSSITLLRFAAAPVFFWVFLHRSCSLALIVFVCAVLTDVADGATARALGVASNAGAYLDAFADFTLVNVAFLAFFQKAWYDAFILALVTVMFAVFIASSGLKKPIYDPLGKYMGAILMSMIGISLLFPEPGVWKACEVLLVAFCGASAIGRCVFLARRKASIGTERRNRFSP